MESQLPHTHGHHYDENELLTSQQTGHDDHNEEEHHGEKKSVFRKFKERAKRFKNTITNHGHSNDTQHDDDEVEEEEDDETVDDPEVFGSPMYDSSKVGLGGPDAMVAPARGNFERPSEITEHRDAKPVDSHSPPLSVLDGAYGTNLSGQSGVGGQEVDPEKWKSKLGQPTGMEEEVPFAPSPTITPPPVTEDTDGTNAFDTFKNCGLDETDGGLKSITGKSTEMMKDDPSELGLGSGVDPANYESKVSNPTHIGGKEEGLSQAQHSFDKTDIHDSGSEQEKYDPEHPEKLPSETLVGNQSTQSSSYTEKIPLVATTLSGFGSGSDPTKYETEVTNPTHTGGKEAGLSEEQHSFDKMGIHDSESKQEMFDPERPENIPRDALAGNQSTQNSSDKEKISSIGTAQSGQGWGSGLDTAKYETKVTNATEIDKEAGLSPMQHSSDEMGIHDSSSEWEKFDTEHSQNLLCDTLEANMSSQSSSDKEKISPIATGQSGLAWGSDPANDETKVTKPTHTEGKESGLSEVHHLFDKMGIHDSGSEQKFDPKHPESLPRDTLPGNQTTQSSSDKEKISSIDTAQSGLGSDPANYKTKDTNPTHTGGTEAGLSQVQQSFDTVGMHDSGSEQKTFDPEHHENLQRDTLPGGNEAGLSQMEHSSDKMGIHDSGSEREKFNAEHSDKLPGDTLSGNLSTQSSSDKEKIPSIATTLGLGSGSGLVSDPANHETNVTNPTHTGGKEAGLSQMQHSSDKVGTQDSVPERKRFDPEHPDNLPRDYLARNQSTQSSTYSEKISSMASAFSEQAVVAKDAIALKFGYSGENPTTAESHENVKNSGSIATDSDKEVKSLLGTDGQQQQSSNVSANKNVIERLSDAAGSWFGGKGDAPQGALGTSHVMDQGLSSDPTGDEKK
uniref:low-temperature-induced 65 kDa protein-like isoform X2 n=1 Tax=Erigeron canadensis TaxID=72917 RepID=UPI001CB8DB16|nr:low-temperature-induced 65 kDa protein-like isoform X2 [Erigeron canadensis]